MGLTVFNQFPQLTRLLARIARVAAHKETARPFARVNLSGGRGSLRDRAVNLVALSGDAATFTETSPIRNPGCQTDLYKSI